MITVKSFHMPVVFTAIVSTALVTILGSYGIRTLLAQVDRGKCMRALSDMTYLASNIEQYNRRQGVYPVASTTIGLFERLPDKIEGRLPGRRVTYFSDGKHYTVLLASADNGAYRSACPILEVKDGQLTSWPEIFTADDIERYNAIIEERAHE